MTTLLTVLTIGLLLSILLTIAYKGIKLYQNFTEYNIDIKALLHNCFTYSLFVVFSLCVSITNLLFLYGVYANCSNENITGVLISDAVLFCIILLNYLFEIDDF